MTVLVAFAAGCGGPSFQPPTFNAQVPGPPALPEAVPWNPVAPTLIAVAPGAMTVGEELTVLGQDFVPAGHGRPIIKITGTYFDDQGQSYPVDRQDYGRRENGAKLTWRLWPNIVFHPQGDRLGAFVGDVTVINATADGAQLPSTPYPVRIEIKPSLIPRVARPSQSECQAVVEGTLEQTRMLFSVEALGLRPGTVEAPLVFRWTFLAQHWTVKFANDTFNPDSNLPQNGAFMLEERVTDGVTSVLQDRGQRSFYVKTVQDAWDTVWGEKRLTELTPKAVPAEGNSYQASVHVAAIDAEGKTIALSIPIEIHRQADLIYDGSTQTAERLPPERVSDCIPGGDIGRQVSYREDKGESHQRTLDFSFNANAAVSSGLPSNPFALGVNFSTGFGVNHAATVSTSENKGLDLSGQVLPGEYGTFYRQTTKVYRIGQLVGYNECGQTIDLGQAILTDWLYTPDLATGMTCPPPSRLPPAQRFM